NGFGNSSGQVGHNLMDHHIGINAGGIVEGFEDKYYYGRRPNITYIPRFRNIDERSKQKNFTRGYAYQTGAGRGGWHRNVDGAEIGAALKDALTEPGSWSFSMTGFAETIPYYENKVTLDTSKKDKWGLPLVAIDCELKENEKAMRKDMIATAAEM